MAAEPTVISISIKLLSGEILSLEVPSDISLKGFYYHVHHQLDPSIRPKLPQQLTLLRFSQEQEESTELSPTDPDPLHPLIDEVFLLLIDPNDYHVDFDVEATCDAQKHDEPWHSSLTYYVMRFYRNGEVIHREPILYDYGESEWYAMDQIPHQISVRNQHEEHNDQDDQDDQDQQYNQDQQDAAVVYVDMDPSMEHSGSIWSISHRIAIDKLHISSNSALLVAYFADVAMGYSSS